MNLSQPLLPGTFNFNGISLGHSAFNCAWLEELGVIPKTIVDVGGYDAGDAIRFKQYFANANVHCFEADPDRAEAIEQYIDSTGVYFKDCAVSDYSGMTKFYQAKCMLKDAGDTHKPGEIGGQGSVFAHTDFYKRTYQHIKQEEAPISVSCISLSDFCFYWIDARDIDFLHIDAEGSELRVIRGLGKFRPKVIYVETLKDMFVGAGTIEELHAELTNRDYELVTDFISDRLYIHKKIS